MTFTMTVYDVLHQWSVQGLGVPVKKEKQQNDRYNGCTHDKRCPTMAWDVTPRHCIGRFDLPTDSKKP